MGSSTSTSTRANSKVSPPKAAIPAIDRAEAIPAIAPVQAMPPVAPAEVIPVIVPGNAPARQV
ncbi:hypothetical protein PI124_g13330 [Phytophthora idaei]|nr:hypothetical protein PI125_g12818 [Phytophthora idaei]KAG3149738.1 hypothetical protein PI126_g11885 [Phytophthora idaei]KAG3241817.1 hypothetical protein PI124_g13330 [Phytophthora idaei]